MKATERIALLSALIAGANAELTKAKTEALTLADEVGVKSFDTQFGSLAVVRPEAAPAVTDEAALLAWVKDAYPTEVETIVRPRPAFVKALLDRVEFAADLGEFVDTVSGEAVPGVDWSSPGAPSITWSATEKQRATKEEARVWFAGRSEELLGAMRQIEGATP